MSQLLGNEPPPGSPAHQHSANSTHHNVGGVMKSLQKARESHRG
jgi:hypothetical protein